MDKLALVLILGVAAGAGATLVGYLNSKIPSLLLEIAFTIAAVWVYRPRLVGSEYPVVDTIVLALVIFAVARWARAKCGSVR